MNPDVDESGLSLSVKEMIALYLFFSRHEDELDDVQRDIFERVCNAVYKKLSLEEIEDIDGHYRSM